MMKNFIYIFLYFLIFDISFAQEDIGQEKSSSYEGRHFIVGFMQNGLLDWYEEPKKLHSIFMTSSRKAEVVVQLPWAQTLNRTIQPNEIIRVDINPQIELRESEVISNRVVEITSDEPIALYCFNTAERTSDSYAAIPIAYWGNEYVVMSFPNDQYYDMPGGPYSSEDSLWSAEPRRSEFMIMAAEDDTQVKIIPKAITRQGKQVDFQYTLNLQKGQTYLVQSSSTPRGYGDLTGSIIRSDKPVGVLSGHVRTAVLQTYGYGCDSKDHIVEMLSPTESWGRHFVSVPFGYHIAGDLFRVTAIHPGTIVTMQTEDESKEYNIDNSGDFVTIDRVGKPAYWTSNLPVQIGQYIRHNCNYDNHNYDPSLVMLPSAEQFVQKIRFQTPINHYTNPNQYYQHFIALAVHIDALDYIKLDGELIKNWEPLKSVNNQIFGTDYNWVRIEIDTGSHELVSEKGVFSGILYGNGPYDSYAMALGSSLNNPFRHDTIPPMLEITEICGFIEGVVQEFIDSNATGIDYVAIVTDSTYNYTWNIDPITDTSTVVQFTARPADLFEDAHIVVDVRDKNGNGNRYRHSYEKITAQLPEQLHFINTAWKDSVKRINDIINTGSEPIYVKSISLSGDPRLTIEISETLPAYIQPGEKISFIVTFNALDDTSDLIAEIAVEFDCDRVYIIPVQGNVIALSLDVTGYDFGTLRVADSACAAITVTNNGNIDVILDSMVFPDFKGVFVFDTTDVFPDTLKPGETLSIDVCFFPPKQKEYYLAFTFVNNRYLSNQGAVTGTGIAPNIPSINIDWGKRRVGTKNDTLAYFTNTGDGPGAVQFKEFLITNGSFSENVIEDFDDYLQPGDSTEFVLSFAPDNPKMYYLEALFNVDWVYHDSVKLNLYGQGTLPDLELYDIDFGSLVVFTAKDTVAQVIKSTGSEVLTIDSLYIISGDTDDFSVKLDSLNAVDNLIISIDSLMLLSAQYFPQTVGAHELIIEAVHDAMPNYERTTSRFRLLGSAFPGDTARAEIALEAPPIVLACRDTILTLEIRNTGNVDLELQQLTLTYNDFDASWAKEPLLPAVLATDSALRFDINLLAKKDSGGTIKIQALLNDSIQKTVEYTFVPQYRKLEIKKLDKQFAAPGDTLRLYLAGVFPASSDLPVDLDLKILADQTAFMLIDHSPLKLQGKSTNEEINLNLIQKLKEISIEKTENLYITDSDVSWSFDMTFLALLNEHQSHTFSITASSPDCYESDTLEISAELTEVCVYTMRNIQLIRDKLAFQLSPNPAANKLQIDLNMPDDDMAKIDIFDQSGKKLTLSSNLYLKKGTYSLIFEITNLTSGVYVVSVHTSTEIRSSMFMITK